MGRDRAALERANILTTILIANRLLTVPFSKVRAILPLFPDQVMINGTSVTMFVQPERELPSIARIERASSRTFAK